MEGSDQQCCPLCSVVPAPSGAICQQCSAKLQKKFPIPAHRKLNQPSENPPSANQMVANGSNPFSEEVTKSLEAGEQQTGELDVYDAYRPSAGLGAPSLDGNFVSGFGIVCFIGWIGFCFYLLSVASGVGIALLVLSIPSLIRTVLVVARRQQSGAIVTGAQKATLLIGSVLTIVVLSLVVGVCVLVGCFVACFVGLTTADALHWIEFGGWVGLIVGVAASLWILVVRWKRDVNG